MKVIRIKGDPKHYKGDLPKNCAECPFHTIDLFFTIEYYCNFNRKHIDYYEAHKNRDKICPLYEEEITGVLEE